MTWYKTGTVSVTAGSNAVIGTGTSFIANSRAGDAFRGPDGQWYEVTNIASDTALSIAPDYQGTAVSAGSYSLAPLQGYVKDSADQLRAATKALAAFNESPNLTAFAELVGVADHLPYFAGSGVLSLAVMTAKARSLLERTDNAGIRAEIAAAGSGANSDITSLAGLTTALSIAQGGTGGTTASAARTALGVDVTLTSAVLDPQTQGGLMGRAVVSGWTVEKFANGLVRIQGSAPNTPIVPANGISSINVTIPSIISDINKASILVNSSATADSSYYGIPGAEMTSATNVFFVIRNGGTAQSFGIKLEVWGPWK